MRAREPSNTAIPGEKWVLAAVECDALRSEHSQRQVSQCSIGHHDQTGGRRPSNLQGLRSRTDNFSLRQLQVESRDLLNLIQWAVNGSRSLVTAVRSSDAVMPSASEGSSAFPSKCPGVTVVSPKIEGNVRFAAA